MVELFIWIILSPLWLVLAFISFILSAIVFLIAAGIVGFTLFFLISLLILIFS